MQERLLSGRELLWIAIVGGLATPAALWLFARFVHSSMTVSVVSLVLMAPYAGLTRWGQDLPDWAFWGVFVIAEAVYLVFGYWVLRTVVRRFVNR